MCTQDTLLFQQGHRYAPVWLHTDWSSVRKRSAPALRCVLKPSADRVINIFILINSWQNAGEVIHQFWGKSDFHYPQRSSRSRDDAPRSMKGPSSLNLFKPKQRLQQLLTLSAPYWIPFNLAAQWLQVSRIGARKGQPPPMKTVWIHQVRVCLCLLTKL